jgi:streptogramin lyase
LTPHASCDARATIGGTTETTRRHAPWLVLLASLFCGCIGLKADEKLKASDASAKDAGVEDASVTAVTDTRVTDAQPFDASDKDAVDLDDVAAGFGDGPSGWESDADACASCEMTPMAACDGAEGCLGDAGFTLDSKDAANEEEKFDTGLTDASEESPSCVSNCTLEGVSQCDEQGRTEICLNLTGCLRWLQLSPCADGSACADGTCVLLRQSIYNNWEKLPGSARDIAIGADGSVWSIGTLQFPDGDSPAQKWTGSDWALAPGGGGVRIAVDPQGIPWILNTLGAIYKASSSDVSTILWGDPLIGAGHDISIGADGSVWLIGTLGPDDQGVVFKWDGRGWAPSDHLGARIGVGPAGEPWIIDSAARIYRQSSADLNAEWIQLPDSARELAINQGDVWIVGTASVESDFGFSIRMLSTAHIPVTDAEAAVVGMDTGDSDAEIVRMDAGSGDIGPIRRANPADEGDGTTEPTWTTVNGAAVAIAVAPDGTPWIVNAAGEIYRLMR